MSKLRLALQYAGDCAGAPPPALARRLALEACRQCGKTAEICARFVSPAESAGLNLRWRGRARPANVLSFCYEQEPALGDIVVCCAVARREAGGRGRRAARRCAHLLVHGVLHLCGHRHHTALAAAKMTLLEKRVLARCGFAEARGQKK